MRVSMTSEAVSRLSEISDEFEKCLLKLVEQQILSKCNHPAVTEITIDVEDLNACRDSVWPFAKG